MKIILISHGTYAQAMKDTAQMIIGAVSDVYAYGIMEGEEIEAFEEKIKSVLQKAKEEGQEVFLFSDIFFGTPFNTAVRLMKEYDICHYAGISLPLLLEILTSKDNMSGEDMKEYIEKTGKKTFINVNEFIKENCKD